MRGPGASPTQRHARAARRGVLAAGLLLVLGAWWAVSLAIRGKLDSREAALGEVPAALHQLGLAAPGDPPLAPPQLAWLGPEVPPLVVDVDGTGAPDLVAPVHFTPSWGGAELRVLAFSGDTRRELWRSPAYAAYTPAAAAHLHVAVLGPGLIVAEPGGSLRLLDQATGRERLRHVLGVPALRLCALADQGGVGVGVGVVLADGTARRLAGTPGATPVAAVPADICQ